MKYRGQSISKRGNNENEDHWYFHQEKRCFTLADGAGGVGVFAKEWAVELTESINNLHSLERVITNIQKLKIEFYQERELFLEAHPNYFADKFFEEGSAATLLGAQLTSNSALKMLSYGDSGIFLYKVKTKRLMTNLTVEHFGDFPLLINCNEPETNAQGFFYEELIYEEGDMLVLCSDAVAKYLYLVYLFDIQNHQELEILLGNKNASSEIVLKMLHMAQFDFTATLEQFEESLITEISFTSFCNHLYEQGLLEYDDYTLVIVRL